MSAEIAQTAIGAARVAGEVLLSEFGHALPVDAHLPHDVKLELDRRCEAAILDRIQSTFPDHGIVSEEIGSLPGSDPYTWYIDPLDGTVNFFHRLPHFCTSIGCYRQDGRPPLGTPVVGVVYAPALDLLFVGGADRPPTVNAEPLSPGGVTDLSRAMVALAFSNRNGGAETLGKLASSLARSAQKVRSFGATALDICLVASGGLGAFIQRGTNSWDLAAGCAVARSAGCAVHLGPHPDRRHRVIVAQPKLFTAVIDIVRRSTQEPWNAYAS